MQKEDLKQLEQLLAKQLKKQFETSNKVILERMDALEERIMTLTKQEFDTVYEKIDRLPDINQIMSWADRQVVPVQRDNERLKFLHLDELKNLPSSLEISRRLIEEGLA